MAAFIQERRDAKLKGDEHEGDKAGKYEYTAWIADAARRAHYLKIATHPIKFTHSAIKGATSAYYRPDDFSGYDEIGTHSVTTGFEKDFAIHDAKHLDVYAFLGVVVEGRCFLDWILDDDEDMASAMSDDSSVAKAMMASFKRVATNGESVVSHRYAKQVYWLVGDETIRDEEYHLLQPLFSSTLEHVVHRDIRNSRDAALSARGTTKNEATYSDHYTYPDLVKRIVGGSNKQNVSPLNKQRDGINYLFSSLPPKWNSRNRIKLLHVDSIFGSFRWFEDVSEILKSLADLLLPDPKPNRETREKREALEQALALHLALFGESIRLSEEPGWTRNPDCRLPLCEKIWLDPERIELPLQEADEYGDRELGTYLAGEWRDEVAGRFANWLNAQLHERGLKTVGDVEYRHWARQALRDVGWAAPARGGAAGGRA